MASVIAPSLTITRYRTHMADETLTLTRYIILSLMRPNVDCPSELAWKFRALVSNVRDEKKLLLSGSCHQISLTNDNAQATFFAIADEVFEDAINWGRIVTFYAFAVEVAEYFEQQGAAHMINNVISWTALFVDQKLSTWIKQDGGWNKLEHLDFASSPTQKLLWKGLLVTATTLGLGAFAAIVYTKLENWSGIPLKSPRQKLAWHFLNY